MFEARYKNKGFVKGTFESPSTNATSITSYQHFAIYNHIILDGPVDLSSEALRIAFVPIFIVLHTYNEILRIPCLTLIEIESHRDLVLQDQKVLPEDRNRLLLLREFCSHSNFEIPTELPAEIPVELLAYIS